jgi:hypothetical protein
MDLAAERAEAINSRIPLSSAPLESAQQFYLPVGLLGPEEREKETDCLAEAIYYEAGAEDQLGQRAVAQVVLNRVRHPAFPNSICAVVFQGSERSTGCQFTFTCDGSLTRRPWPAAWARVGRIAAAALAGRLEPAVGTATHYHTRSVVPYWAWNLEKIAVVGSHIFYRWPGQWGRRPAFSASYSRPSPAVPHLTTEPMLDQSAGVLTGRNNLHPHTPGLLKDDKIVPLSAVYEASRAQLPASHQRIDQVVGTLKADEPKSVLRLDSGGLEEPINLAHKP